MDSIPAETTAPTEVQLRSSEMKKGWFNLIPWIITLLAIGMLLSVSVYMIKEVQWFTSHAFEKNDPARYEHSYRNLVFQLHSSLVKRTTAIFTGFAVLLIGLAMIFYTSSKTSTFGADTSGLSMHLVTASPGLIAMLIGMTIVLYSIGSKDFIKGSLPSSEDMAPYEVHDTTVIAPPLPSK